MINESKMPFSSEQLSLLSSAIDIGCKVRDRIIKDNLVLQGLTAKKRNISGYLRSVCVDESIQDTFQSDCFKDWILKLTPNSTNTYSYMLAENKKNGHKITFNRVDKTGKVPKLVEFRKELILIHNEKFIDYSNTLFEDLLRNPQCSFYYSLVYGEDKSKKLDFVGIGVPIVKKDKTCFILYQELDLQQSNELIEAVEIKEANISLKIEKIKNNVEKQLNEKSNDGLYY